MQRYMCNLDTETPRSPFQSSETLMSWLILMSVVYITAIDCVPKKNSGRVAGVSPLQTPRIRRIAPAPPASF
jgi:hypothetical protein